MFRLLAKTFYLCLNPYVLNPYRLIKLNDVYHSLEIDKRDKYENFLALPLLSIQECDDTLRWRRYYALGNFIIQSSPFKSSELIRVTRYNS